MIKYQEIELKTKNDLGKVPNPFIGLLTEMHIGKTVVSFKTGREDVTISKELLKVLNKLTAKNKDVLILTNNLTEEGRIILNDRKINHFTKTDFYWTDNSYINIRK